jgi:oxygen-independent coproporphyrinogen-3 oxidase
MVTNRPERINAYVRALKKEIELISALTGKRRVQTLHFGGGTPNILSNEAVCDLFDHLKSHFDLSAVHEIAMELDPRITTPEQIKTLAKCGITRVSLGVQDFDANVQAAIHRVQPFEIVEDVCTWLRAEGINRINFDLLYGLPKQTLETVTDSAIRACELHPSRIALFSYAHVPQIKKHQMALEEHGIPSPQERVLLDQAARGILISRGYQAIGIDHFVSRDDTMMEAWSKGKLHRNFQGYTEDDSPTLIGLGVSSISKTPDGFFQNERDHRIYQYFLEDHKIPVQRGYLLSLDDRVRSAIIERLMCNFSCDVEEVCKSFDYPISKLAPIKARLKPFEKAGIIARDNFALCLTSPHRMAIRVICALFDAYAEKDSKTIASRTA